MADLETIGTFYQVDPSGCWLWTRATNSKGYGVVWWEGKVRLAHRVMFYLTHGHWPTRGLVVDHVCERPRCVNPAHLRELSNGENIARAYPRGDAKLEHTRAIRRKAKAKWRAKQKEASGGLV